MGKKVKKLPGIVDKIIKSQDPNQPDKAQITIQGADDLYKEIRIDNVVTDEKGKTGQLTQGEPVDVTVEADSATHADAAKKQPQSAQENK